MLSKDVTFCDIHRKLDICKSCERHILHESNKRFKKEPRLSLAHFLPEKTHAHEHCDQYITYPIQEK